MMSTEINTRVFLSGLLATGLISSVAHADSITASGYAHISITDFNITVLDPGSDPVDVSDDVVRPLAPTDIIVGSGGNSSTTFAELNSGSVTDGDSVTSSFISPAGLNPDQAFVGNVAAPVENSFGNLVGLNGDTFARSDVEATGVVTSGSIRVESVSDVDVTGRNDGSTLSSVGTNIGFRFTGITALTLDFDAIAEASASLGSDLLPGIGTSATADTSLVIELTNFTQQTSPVSVAGLDALTLNAVAPFPGTTDTRSVPLTNFNQTFSGLNSSDVYSLRILQQSNASASAAIPSPTAAAFGLFGLAAVGMRRRRPAND